MLPQQYKTLHESRAFSEEKLRKIRSGLDRVLREKASSENFAVIAAGSYGRLEATKASDLDVFLISDKGLKLGYFDHLIDDLEEVITTIVPKEPGTTGTFGSRVCVSTDELVSNIGGDQDDNKAFTRRMLFLLESTWLWNQGQYDFYRRELLQKYIKEETSDSPLNYFFLNDMIRYYRTIATDYEFKVSEDQKSWALRNIKLRFSRKLIYFSGLLVVANTTTGSQNERINETERLLSLTPLDRVMELVEPELCEEILRGYEEFSRKVADSSVRTRLEKATREEREKSQDFVELRDSSRHFNNSLVKAIQNIPSDNAMHTALLF